MAFLSGLYQGERTAPVAGQMQLDLRIDVDARQTYSPVMNRVSGDFFQINESTGTPPSTWRVYQESWVVETPVVNNTAEPAETVITGTLRYYNQNHPATKITIRIPILPVPATSTVPAVVELHRAGVLLASFSCPKKSDCFREFNLEISVCQSVEKLPRNPIYNTHSRTDHPANLGKRTLTMAEAYNEAGVLLNLSPTVAIVDDAANPITQWSSADLHHAMESHFTQYAQMWPRWDMWGFLATQYSIPSVGGLMFDTSAAYGGAGSPPERQGFAVFGKHHWFANLVANPTTPAQFEATRKYLYAWVHEAGHAFNFSHSWDKNRPDSLSWMNYDWKYDDRNGADAFWSNFFFRFDDEELIHLRHGNRSAVIMGGDPWVLGAHVESPGGTDRLEPPPGAMIQIEGTPPLELTLRSSRYFEFLEPVTVEVRLQNKSQNAIDVRSFFSPDYGNVTYYVRRPDGRLLEYAPIACKVTNYAYSAADGTSDLPLDASVRRLRPADATSAATGADRYSEEVFLSYGRYGFYFDQPGTYLVRAVYNGSGNMIIPSNVLRLQVGFPLSRAEDRMAQDYFSYEVGMSLYLNGSRSPFLKSGMDRLQELAARGTEATRSMAAVKAAMTVASSLAKPFLQIDRTPSQPPPITNFNRGITPTSAAAASPPKPTTVSVRKTPADPKEALKWTSGIVTRLQDVPGSNLLINSVANQRASLLRSMGDLQELGLEVAKAVSVLTTHHVPKMAMGALYSFLDTVAPVPEVAVPVAEAAAPVAEAETDVSEGETETETPVSAPAATPAPKRQAPAKNKTSPKSSKTRSKKKA